MHLCVAYNATGYGALRASTKFKRFMRKFKIRKLKTTELLTISPEQDRVQMLTKFAEDLKKYSPEDMPEVNNIRAWVDRELAKSLTKTKVHNLFKQNTKYSI